MVKAHPLDDQNPVDAVIAWVDGNDPAHIARRRPFAGDRTATAREGTEETRFVSQGEIYVCIASILKYLPFVRTIWIVTDRQRPALLDAFVTQGICAKDRIRVVDHTEVFRDLPAAQPNFNSLAIETVLWRIPGIADNFIYFNDDFFVNRALKASYFFDAGRPIVRGKKKRLGIRLFRDALRKRLRHLAGMAPDLRASYSLAQRKAAAHVGRRGWFVAYGHWPHPMRTSTLAAFYADRLEDLKQQTAFRFRDCAQYAPVSLSYHLEDLTDVRAAPIVAYIDPAKAETKTERMITLLATESADFACLQSIDMMDADLRMRLFDILRSRFGAFLPAGALD